MKRLDARQKLTRVITLHSSVVVCVTSTLMKLPITNEIKKKTMIATRMERSVGMFLPLKTKILYTIKTSEYSKCTTYFKPRTFN